MFVNALFLAVSVTVGCGVIALLVYVWSAIFDIVMFPDRFLALIFQLIVFAVADPSLHCVLFASASVAVAVYVPILVAFTVPLSLYSALLSTPVCSSPLYVNVFPVGISIFFAVTVIVFFTLASFTVDVLAIFAVISELPTFFVVNAPVFASISNTSVVPLVYVTFPAVPSVTFTVAVAVFPVVPYIIPSGVVDVHDSVAVYFCTVIVMSLFPGL